MRALRTAGVLLVSAGASLSGQTPVTARAGRVVAAGSGEPLLHARVDATLKDQVAASVLTDADGRFALEASSTSTIHVTKAGFLPVTSTTTDSEIALVKASAISGRLLDPSGQGISGAIVTAEQPTTPARDIAQARTDDRGDYRLFGLPAGRFFVRVDMPIPLVHDDGAFLTDEELASLRGVPTMRAGQPVPPGRLELTLYYPGVPERTDAQPLAVSVGEDRQNIDLMFAPVVPRTGLGLRPSMTSAAAVANPPPDAARIRGRVVSATGEPLGQAVVGLDSIGPGDRLPPVLTDADGRYEFAGMRPGTYVVTAVKSGFLRLGSGQRRPSDLRLPIDLQARDVRENVDVVLSRSSAIAGQILDEVGQPVEGAAVQVWQVRYQHGQHQLVEADAQGTHRTDDRGAYRLFNLPPGPYIVSATPAQSAVPGYVTTYAPATFDPSAAQPLVVELAQDVTSADVALVRTTTVRVTGVAVDSAGQPFAGTVLQRSGDIILPDDLILAPRHPAGAIVADPLRAHVESDGRFAFENVVPGDYVLQAVRINEPSDEGEFVSQPLSVGNTDLTNLQVRLGVGSIVKGAVVLDSPDDGAAFASIGLEAVPVDADRTPRSLQYNAVARIRTDGTFDIAGLSGLRVLRLTGARNWTLESVRLDGRDITDVPLDLGRSQTVSGLEVVLTAKSTDITGHVVDDRGRRLAGASVVVFPTDIRQWADSSRFLASDRSDRTGAFAIKRLPPGNYYVAATTPLDASEARDPDVLQSLLPSATTVSVLEGDTMSVDVRFVPR